MNIAVTTAMILDTRRAKNDGKYPVKLRVTFERKQKYYPIKLSPTEDKLSLTKKEFEEATKPKPSKNYKELSHKLRFIETSARNLIDNLPLFSFQIFDKKFGSDYSKANKNNVYTAYQHYIDTLNQDGRASTAYLYKCGLNSFKSYQDELSFHEITPEFLKEYQKWMLSEGNSYTTIGIYTRQLRALFNEAVASGNINKDLYPFGRRKYEIPTGRNVKKALPISDIEKIYSYDPQTKSEEKYRDLWLFSYFANGMNIKDIIQLKYKDIHNNQIVFNRAKTINTSRKNPKPVVAALIPEIVTIIDKWGSTPRTPENFVFPYLIDGLSAEREVEIKRQLIKQINKYIRSIAKKVGIEKDVTTYTARHSFATVLKRSGAPVEFISESLGHKDIRTTEDYLDSFEDDVKKQYASYLTNFRRKE